MVQLIALFVCGIASVYLLKRSFELGPRSEKHLIFGLILLFPGVLALLVSVVTVSEHVGAEAEIARYEQIKVAVKTARPGDPSYSGVLQSALDFNKDLAVYKLRNPSIWFDIFYSDKLAALEPIEFPAGSR